MSEPSAVSRKRRYFAGATVEQALVLAARYHGIDPAEITYRRLEKRHGFVKVPRRVILEVDPACPKRLLSPSVMEKAAQLPRTPPVPPLSSKEQGPSAPRASARPVEEVSKLPTGPPLSEEDLVAAARDAVDRLLRFSGLELSAEVRLEEGEVRVELTGRDRPLLLEEEAEVLQAIEHLLPRCLGVSHRESLGCRVDSEGFRSRREEELRSMATAAAASVRATGQAVKLDPLSPAERRLIHMTLSEVPGVVTESEGDGHLKRVAVRPA